MKDGEQRNGSRCIVILGETYSLYRSVAIDDSEIREALERYQSSFFQEFFACGIYDE